MARVQTPLQVLSVTRNEIQQIRALRERSERKVTGLFVVEGVKVVREAVASPLTIETVYATQPDFLNGVEGDFSKENITAKELERMSSFTTPNVTVAVVRIPEVPIIKWDDDLILALDGIRDPGNMGTMIRTACWFGIRQILCSPDCVDAFSPKVVQGAMGALFHTSIISCDLKAELTEAKTHGFQVVTATLEGDDLHEAKIPGRNLLVIGSESHGVSSEVREVCDQQVRIPSFGDAKHVESLNAAIAAGILISELRQRAGHVKHG
jgi:TrmH family RNA methyltransferase